MSHIVLMSPREARKVPGRIGTHQFVWEAFDVWSKGDSAATLLGEIIAAWNVSLGEFCDACYSTASLKPFLQDILQRWGVDLKTYVEDRNARNEASYRPRFLNDGSGTNAFMPMDFVNELWSIFEPTDTRPFEFIDRPLFALCYKALKSQIPTRGSLVTRLLSNGISQANLIAQYVEIPERDLPLFVKLARSKTINNSIQHTMGMIARAGLLSRIAIGSCNKLFAAAGMAATDVEWWFQSTALLAGIVAVPYPNALDLWADVRDALDTYAVAKPISSQNELLIENSSLVATLQQCERLSIWGLAR